MLGRFECRELKLKVQDLKLLLIGEFSITREIRAELRLSFK